MSNHFNYPEITIAGKDYIVYSAFNKVHYFQEHYKIGFANFSEEKLFEFATWVFEVKKSKFNVEEQFLIKTGEA